MQSTNMTSAVLGAKTGTRAEALTGAFMAALLGVVIVWGVGFSQIEAMHNTAHDTRHANAFPCH